MKSFYEKLKSFPSKPSPHMIESGQGAYFIVNGQKKLNFCSSHYLGFAVDERLKKAAISAIKKYGLGTGYRTLAGTNNLNTELEKRLAKFKKAEGAVVFPSGYLANMAAIQTIMTKEDIIFSDELNHASIIDAVRLSGVKNKFIYKHGDTNNLKTQISSVKTLIETPKKDGSKPTILFVTDGVFSMDGDLAPLPELVKIAHQFDALVMVDDAHGEGILGKGGRGIVDHFNLHGQVDIEVGTLSKAFSVIGGFITAKKELIQFYKGYARQFMFTSAMTVPDTAALIEAVKILQKSDSLIRKLWKNTDYLKKNLRKLGFDTGNSYTPITPIVLGDEKLAKEFANQLFNQGIFASAITFPMVAKGAARIRLIPSAGHSKKDIDFALTIIKNIGEKLEII